MVTPAFNEADGLPQFAKELEEILPPLADDYEILVVDDGSQDATLEVLDELNARNARIRYVSLSRNFGHQAAILAGLENARGDVVISMDADLQHPPKLLPQMVDLWRDEYDVVYTIKRPSSSALSLWRRLLMKVGYSILRRVSGMDLQFHRVDGGYLHPHMLVRGRRDG